MGLGLMCLIGTESTRAGLILAYNSSTVNIVLSVSTQLLTRMNECGTQFVNNALSSFLYKYQYKSYYYIIALDI